MAEVLGAVASGIALAEIALKLKSLLGEINDAPETLESLVNQVEIYAGILNGLDLDDVLDTEISPSLRSSLHAAALQCHNAVNQLSLVVTDLSALSKASSRRRKIAAIRFVLQKDLIFQLEHRLQTAVQCLSLAQQLYMFAWQKIQLPDVIVSRLQSQHMGLPPQTYMAMNGSSAMPTMRAWSRPASTRAGNTMVDDYPRTHGAALLDGASGFEATDQYRDNESGWKGDNVELTASSQYSNEIRPYSKATEFRRKLYLPTWSSSYAFEIFAQHSYTGWKASLAVYNVYGRESRQYDAADRLLCTNDAQKVYQALERREFSLHDRFLIGEYEHSFAEFALATASWKSCNYLLEISSQSLNDKRLQRYAFPQDEENMRQLEKILKRDNISDSIRLEQILYFVGDGASFDRFRREVWMDDDEFYHESHLMQRNQMAVDTARHSEWCTSAYRFFRHLLSPLGSLRSEDLYLGWLRGTTLLHSLALAISSIPWRLIEDSSCKQSLAYLKGTSRDSKKYIKVAMLDGWALVASEVIPLFNDLHSMGPTGYYGGYGLKTALYESFAQSIFKPLGKKRVRSLAVRFLIIEASLKLWLNILHNVGVGLKEYGEKEAEILLSQETSMRRFTMSEGYPTRHEEFPWRYELQINLIGFQYGAEIDDWKLWWSEPSDVFAGEFWNLVESPYQPVPGAWPEN